MKENEKTACEGQLQPSHDPRNPRKAISAASKGSKSKGKGKPSTPMTAAERRKVEQVRLPEGGALTSRYIDTIDVMFKRKQLDGRQHWAAGVYQRAFDRVNGGAPGSLSRALSGGVGSAPGSRMPGDAVMEAAQRLAEAARVLGLIDGRVVALIVGQGHTIEEAAAVMAGRGAKPSTRDTEHVGRRLRDGLTALADAWGFPRDKGRRNVEAMRAPVDHEQVAAFLSQVADGTRQIEAGRVAHVTSGGVYWHGSGEESANTPR